MHYETTILPQAIRSFAVGEVSALAFRINFPISGQIVFDWHKKHAHAPITPRYTEALRTLRQHYPPHHPLPILAIVLALKDAHTLPAAKKISRLVRETLVDTSVKKMLDEMSFPRGPINLLVEQGITEPADLHTDEVAMMTEAVRGQVCEHQAIRLASVLIKFQLHTWAFEVASHLGLPPRVVTSTIEQMGWPKI